MDDDLSLSHTSQDYSINLHEDQIQELRKRIKNIIDVLESISNHLSGGSETDLKKL